MCFSVVQQTVIMRLSIQLEMIQSVFTARYGLIPYVLFRLILVFEVLKFLHENILVW